ncbi:MAG: winged helix-turn-helix transcriptional regulator [Ornithinimicrobium sp.]
MRTYRQYCPIARASEVIAERWTPIILRNMISGAETFTEIADGAPGLSRSLLSTRLRDLERAGVLQIVPHERGHGHRYRLTTAGHDLGPVLLAMGDWAQRWFELSPQDSDPGFLLHTWVTRYLAVDRLPPQRVVVRFDLLDQPVGRTRLWLVIDGERSEVCLTHPGHPEDLVVTGHSTALAQWHVGQLEWSQALRTGRLKVDGPRDLARALPTWNQRSLWAGQASTS